MKIEREPLEDHQIKLNVEIDEKTFEETKRRAARRIASRTKIPGFRPGKAPYHIIVRSVGEPAVVERAVEILIDDQYASIIKEADIKPYGPGRLEDIVSVDPLVLSFIVPLAAKVELGDYRSIRIPYELPAVSDEDINEVLENLRDSQAIEEPAEKSLEQGDRAFLVLSGRRTVLEEGKDEYLIKERQHSVIIQPEENGSDNEWPFSGFSRQLIGMNPGDEKTISHTYPQEPNFEALAGKTVEFSVQIEEVKTRSLPELDDEFAQSVGEFDTFNDLTNTIRESLEQQATDNYNREYDDQILEGIIDQSTIAYPPQMLEEEIDVVIRRIEGQLEAQNLDLETYLLTQGMSEEDFREDTKPVAESRLKRSLVLLEISEAENIQLDTTEVKSRAENQLKSIAQYMSESDRRKLNNQYALANLTGNIAAEMTITQSMQFLRSLAKGELDQIEDSPADEQLSPETDQAQMDEIEPTSDETATLPENEFQSDEREIEDPEAPVEVSPQDPE